MKGRFTAYKLIWILISVLFVLSACVFMGLQKRSVAIIGRGDSMKYTVGIRAKAGEEPDRVTLYLPFPRSGNELLPDLFDKLKNDTTQSAEYEGTVINSVDTRYGKMLKIVVPGTLFRRKSSIFSKGFRVDESYGYGRLFPIGNSFEDHQLWPVLPIDIENKPRVINDTTKAVKKEVPIYVDFKNSSGILLNLKYSTAYENHYVPTYPSRHERSWIGGDALVKNSNGYQVTGEDVQIEITKKGWIRLPIWIIYEANDKTP